MARRSQKFEMSTKTEMDQKQRLRQVTEKVIGLPSLPTVVTQLINLVGDPATSARDISQLISADQALTAKILKVANSAFYGFPRKIATVQLAIVVLGFETVKNLGLSVAVLKRFQAGKAHPLFDRQQFWEHAIGCGVAARMLAHKRSKKLEPEAFVAGILHDIGKLILIEYFPDEFGEALELAHEELLTISEAEMKVIGVTHAEIGGWLAEKWNLPETLVQAITHHHDPMAMEDPNEILMITHAANALTRHNHVGQAGDSLGASLSPEASAMFKAGRDISDEDLLAELSEGLEVELEKARVFNDLEAELFESRGSDDDDEGEPVGA
ncbi:MAG: HD family phosphohydrolase [Gemmatimonadetes bacterium]|nr:HD family phosphohydrolase [Gemmatimonadota bacterium]